MDAHMIKSKQATRCYTGSGAKDLKKNQSFESHQEIRAEKGRAFTYRDLGEESKIINWNQFAHIVCTVFRSHKLLHISKSILTFIASSKTDYPLHLWKDYRVFLCINNSYKDKSLLQAYRLK